MVDWNLTLGVQTIYIKLLSYIPFHFRYLRKQMTSVLIRIVKQKMLTLKQDGVNIHQIPNQVILWNMYGTRSYAITMWRRVYFTKYEITMITSNFLGNFVIPLDQHMWKLNQGFELVGLKPSHAFNSMISSDSRLYKAALKIFS